MRIIASMVIAAFALIISSFLFADAFKNRNNGDDTISVTGSGKTDFTSDLIVWSGTFSRKAFTLKDAYSALDSDRAQIRSYLLSKGIAQNEVVFSDVNFNKD